MITIQIDGENYQNFKSAFVNVSIDNLARGFELTMSATEDNLLPFYVGKACKIVVDGNTLLTGYIDKSDVSAGVTEHSILLSGRSQLADLIDSSVKPKEYDKLNYIDICKSVLSDLNINVSVVNKVGTITPFKDNVVSVTGEKAFKFLEKLGRKKQVLLNDDVDGNLVITRAGSEVTGVNIIREKEGLKNNILSSRSVQDISKRYNAYVFDGENSIFESTDSPEVMLNQLGKAIDSEIRGSRYLELDTEGTYDSSLSINRAIWERNLRKAKFGVYSCVMQGHSYDKKIIPHNSLIYVKDDYCGIDKELLVVSIVYRYDLQQGSLRQITFSDPKAYEL